MKKIIHSLGHDLWVVLLDILAVNASYYLALLIRFYVNSEFRPTVSYLLGDWARFAPFYTVLAIVIFALFRLYGGMWRYAGINDMNRIIGANVCTTLVMVLGTLLFIRRMPITYYGIGGVLQFFGIVLIRFAYRLLLVEKRRLGARNAVPAMVIGSGDTGRRVIRHLVEDTDNQWKAVVMAGYGAGRTMDGVPIVSLEEIGKAIETYKVRCVFVADPLLSAESRKHVKRIADEKKLEFVDYTGYLANLSGAVSLTSLLELVKGPVTLVVDGKKKDYESGEAALASLPGRYVVRGLTDATIEISREEQSPPTTGWANGEDVSFF